MRRVFISKKFLVILVLIGSLGLGSSIKASGTYNDRKTKPEGVVPVTYFWKIASKKKTGTSNGSWRDGPSGKGPSSLSITESTKLNTLVKGSISGSYPISVAVIGAALEFDINKSINYKVNYKVDIPKDKTYQIIFRPVYNVYTVVQHKYSKTGNISSKTKTKATAQVKKFAHWAYSWKQIK